jgi:hypothetical protein
MYVGIYVNSNIDFFIAALLNSISKWKRIEKKFIFLFSRAQNKHNMSQLALNYNSRSREIVVMPELNALRVNSVRLKLMSLN